MATLSELAGTLADMRGEMARRIDDLSATNDMTSGAAASMGGILEWMSSLEEAIRRADGRPSPAGSEEAAARGESRLVRLWGDQAAHVRAHLPEGHPLTASVLASLDAGGVGTFFREADLAHLAPEAAWAFLARHEGRIADAMCEAGQEAIEQLLAAEGLSPPEDGEGAGEGEDGD